MKKLLIGAIVGAILASLWYVSAGFSKSEERQTQEVLQTKMMALHLHRSIDDMKYQVALEEVKRLENRILYQESRLDMTDHDLQHWLDQSHGILLQLNESLNEKEKTSKGYQLPHRYYY